MQAFSINCNFVFIYINIIFKDLHEKFNLGAAFAHYWQFLFMVQEKNRK